ncbi:MAG: GreA/GreB family elongation factor [Chryseosolibacter sp.]
MEKTMHITVNDYQRITELTELPALQKRDPVIADRLFRELKVAKRFPQNKISKSIVTMNSRALLKELKSGRETEITIVYPQDADIREKKVSLFSPIGVALLGCREGDIASWRVPAGVGRFKVEKVLYQPEAEGHYSL